MAQITFELDERLAPQMEQLLAHKQLSVTNWLNELIEQRLNNCWVDQIIDSADLWDDFPMAEELRANSVPDVPREPL